MVAHHMKKKGLVALVIIPFTIVPYFLLTGISGVLSSWGEFLINCTPINMSIIPPTNPIINVARGEPISHPKPASINITRPNSAIICPLTIMGPTRNPFCIESEIVTVSMGPGASAPDNPTKKDVNVNKTTSIIKSLTRLLKKSELVSEKRYLMGYCN